MPLSKVLQTILMRETPDQSLARMRVSHTLSHTTIQEAKMSVSDEVKFPKRGSIKVQEPIEKYIPKRAVNDPVRLGSQTVQAVDVIGQMASSNIEDVATEIEKGCAEVCSELRTISDGIRVSTIEASARVAMYCDRVNGLVAGIRHVHDALQPTASREMEAAEVEDVERRMYEGGS